MVTLRTFTFLFFQGSFFFLSDDFFSSFRFPAGDIFQNSTPVCFAFHWPSVEGSSFYLFNPIHFSDCASRPNVLLQQWSSNGQTRLTRERQKEHVRTPTYNFVPKSKKEIGNPRYHLRSMLDFLGRQLQAFVGEKVPQSLGNSPYTV